MRFGIVSVHCPVCGTYIRYNEVPGTYHHKTFGIVCGKACFEQAELKYARMILGKDDKEIVVAPV